VASNAEVIRELTRAKVTFQLRAIETVLTDGHAPHCRWCRDLVIRGLPCTCERAQEEARRIRADRR
jgi:hypothetical protein